jgi:hypothetical protein
VNAIALVEHLLETGSSVILAVLPLAALFLLLALASSPAANVSAARRRGRVHVPRIGSWAPSGCEGCVGW